jgi:putative transposase
LGRFYVEKRFSGEQIICILKDADRGDMTLGEECRSQAISENTLYRRRRHYAGLDIPEVRRLHEIETGNARLKRPMAECDLEIDAL